MKKRKFLSLFAIIFVAIFALSVCFFAACKGGEKDEDNSGDSGTQQDGGDTGTGDSGDGTGTGNEGTGSGNENEGQTRTGDPLDVNDEIIGKWMGDVEISATVYGFGGTIDSEMTATITKDDFTLVFTPTAIDLGVFSSIAEPYLEQVGIAVGVEFEMFANMPIYTDDEGYFVDIDGDYFKCQLSGSIVDGLLSIDFDQAMTFGDLSIDIVFEAKLVSEAELAIEKIIDLADKELTYSLDDGTAATFANDNSLSIRTTDGINYAVSGPASAMGEAEAAYYDTSDIQEGALYVVLKIAVAEDESITFVYSNKTYVNSEDEDAEEFENGYIYVIQALHGDENGTGYAAMEFVITADDGVTTATYTVTFDDVTEPAEVVTRTPSITSGDETITEVTLEVGDTLSLTAAVAMSDESDYGYFTGSTWVSSYTDVATISYYSFAPKTATLTAVGAGTTTVTLTIAEGETATLVVTVNAPLVKIYDGTVVGFGIEENTADFKNTHDLEIVTTTDEGGNIVCSIEGMATLFTEKQATAFGGEATTSDAYVVIKIPASIGSTVTFNGVEEVITEDSTSGVYILGVRTGTTSNPMEVGITDGNGNTVSEFKISIANLVIPDDIIEGVWSGTITASVTYSDTEYTTAAMDVEVTIEPEGKVTIVITDINLNDNDGTSLPSSVATIELNGTWSASADGGYTFGITASSSSGITGNNVTVLTDAVETLELTADTTSGEMQIKISFGIKYEYKLFGSVQATVEITVTDAVLGMD